MTQKELNLKKNPLLTIEVIPPSAWFANIRKITTPQTWNKIKAITSTEYNNQCFICHGQGEKWPIECHEQWLYDDIDHIQYLKKVVALCPDCHSVKHWGFTELQGKDALKRAKRHICKINNWDKNDLNKYLNYICDVFEIRSKYEWTLNTESLTNVFPFILNDKSFVSFTNQ